MPADLESGHSDSSGGQVTKPTFHGLETALRGPLVATMYKLTRTRSSYGVAAQQHFLASGWWPER